MPTATELVAHGRTEKQVSQEIGSDWLIYQDLSDLVDAVSHYSSSIKEFDTSCFSGEYITGDISTDYLNSLQEERSDEAKSARDLSAQQEELAVS